MQTQKRARITASKMTNPKRLAKSSETLAWKAQFERKYTALADNPIETLPEEKQKQSCHSLCRIRKHGQCSKVDGTRKKPESRMQDLQRLWRPLQVLALHIQRTRPSVKRIANPITGINVIRFVEEIELVEKVGIFFHQQRIIEEPQNRKSNCWRHSRSETHSVA